MAAHYEWMFSTGNPVEVLHEGDEVHGAEEPVSEELALVFGTDNGAIIEGSRDELLEMLERAKTMLASPWPCQH
jgi:hypothetical protein